MRKSEPETRPARCVGYPNCDGDLPGEAHSEGCPALVSQAPETRPYRSVGDMHHEARNRGQVSASSPTSEFTDIGECDICGMPVMFKRGVEYFTNGYKIWHKGCVIR